MTVLAAGEAREVIAPASNQTVRRCFCRLAVLALLLICLAHVTIASDHGPGCEPSCLIFTNQAMSDSSRAIISESSPHTISGFVSDEESGENLIGANIYAPYYGAGATTNRFGYFSLTVDADSITLAISHVGYAVEVLHLTLANDTRLDVRLRPAAVSLDEIEVIATDGDSPVEATQMSAVNLAIARIRALPALAGEVDVLKTLQLLPGVQSGREGTTGMYVRGGGPDQNLVLLDGVTVYNPSHLFGFMSVFNGDAIKDVTLIKGGFPARYGGRLSSVIDLSMKEGNMRAFQGTASVGLVASSFTLEGPIKRDRASFLVAARRTYIDLLIYPFLKKQDKAGYYFYDFSAKTNYVASGRDRFYLSFYTGRDRGYRKRHPSGGTGVQRHTDQNLGWRNLTATGRWNRILGPRFFMNALLGYTRYRLRTIHEETLNSASVPAEFHYTSFLSGITDGTGRLDFEFALRPSHYLRFGIGATAHAYHTGALTERQSGLEIPSVDTLYTPEHLTRSTEWNAYAEDDMRLFPWLKLNAGVHASGIVVAERWYRSIQPRLGLWLGLNPATSLKLSYADMQQYIHVLTPTSGFSLPLDLWVPATDRVRPQQARQVALGLARTLQDRRYEITIESYYKRMRNLIEYKEGASFDGAVAGSWQDKVEHGQGWSYGGELFLQKKTGRVTGWVGYSLTKTERRFVELNDGQRFPYRYDRLHDVSLVVRWHWKESVELVGNWVYGTGQAVWLPVGHYYGLEHEPGGDYGVNARTGTRTARIYGSRNASRMAPYHRFDMAVHLKRDRRRWERTWSFGLYNAYNRKNPFVLDATEVRGEDRQERYLLFRKTSLFPVLPFVTYRLEF